MTIILCETDNELATCTISSKPKGVSKFWLSRSTYCSLRLEISHIFIIKIKCLINFSYMKTNYKWYFEFIQCCCCQKMRHTLCMENKIIKFLLIINLDELNGLIIYLWHFSFESLLLYRNFVLWKNSFIFIYCICKFQLPFNIIHII